MTIIVDVPITNVAGNCVTYVRVQLTEEQYAEHVARQTQAVIVDDAEPELTLPVPSRRTRKAANK